MTPAPQVLKTGGLWRGQIVSLTQDGDLVTNFESADLIPLARHSKVWFQAGSYPGTIRGIQSAGAALEPGKIFAVEGRGGVIEFRTGGGSAARLTGLQAGDPVVVSFHA